MSCSYKEAQENMNILFLIVGSRGGIEHGSEHQDCHCTLRQGCRVPNIEYLGSN